MEVGATARPPASLRHSPGARWSTGVIMYTLLAGSPPFWHRKQMLMLRMIMSGNYQFGSPEWDDYSDTVKDLVRGRTCWLPGAGEGQVQCSRRGGGSRGERWERWRRLLGERPRPDTSSVPPCFSQVSRFLVVSPQSRCSAEEALAHPFFQQYVVEEVRHFSPRGKFKVLRAHLPLRVPGAGAGAPETQAPSALHKDSLRPRHFRSTRPSPSHPALSSQGSISSSSISSGFWR